MENLIVTFQLKQIRALDPLNNQSFPNIIFTINIAKKPCIKLIKIRMKTTDCIQSRHGIDLEENLNITQCHKNREQRISYEIQSYTVLEHFISKLRIHKKTDESRHKQRNTDQNRQKSGDRDLLKPLSAR